MSTTKLSVRFTTESQNIKALLKTLISGAHKDDFDKVKLHGNIARYLRSRDYNITYLEYLFLRLLYPGMTSKKYSISMVNYGRACGYRFDFEKFIDQAIKFTPYYKPPLDKIDKDNRHTFLNDPEMAHGMVKVVKAKFRFREMFAGLIQHSKDSRGKIDKEFLSYFNTAYQIHQGIEHISPRSTDRNEYLVDFFDIHGEISHNSNIPTSRYVAEKIHLNYFGLSDVYELSKDINKKDYDILYIVTYNARTYASNIRLLRQFFLTKTGGVYKILHPDDSPEPQLHKKCLFVIISERDHLYNCKKFFEKITYYKHTGIYINPKPEIEGRMF